MSYRYFICDVFTDTRFGGNQLAVLPDARGLSTQQMQQIAREFNFSESTFVLPAQHGNTRQVRIFTPTAEVPFAGHPNIGTAFCLASAGELGELNEPMTVTFEEKAGLVPVSIQPQQGAALWCELAAPERVSIGKAISVEMLAEAISLSPADVRTDTHSPLLASVGLPFVMAELNDRQTLETARANMPGLEAIAALGIMPDVHLYTRSNDEFDLRARMFAPMDGVPEDPATGSANCALAGLLAHCDEAATGEYRWRIAQGVEMGRPSTLIATASKAAGVVTSTGVGGTCVMVSEGTLQV